MRLLKGGLFLILVFTAVMAFAWQAGDRILGQWGDGYWYPANITSQEGAGFRVNFDDGDTAVLPVSKIRAVNWNVGTKVQCNWKNGGMYYQGTITAMNGESIHISYDDGDQEDTTISYCRSR